MNELPAAALTRRRLLALSVTGVVAAVSAGRAGTEVAGALEGEEAAPTEASGEVAVVTVDCGEDLGPSRVYELLGAMGPPAWGEATMAGVETPSSRYSLESWRAAGLEHERGGVLLDPVCVRRSGGRLRLDFTAFDRLLEGVLDPERLASEPCVVLWTVPKILSRPRAQDAGAWAPADYGESEEFVSRVVERVVARGARGALYEVWNEPDDAGWWRGRWRRRKNTQEERLLDYVELCAHTRRAVKAADPSALVGAPVTAHWDGSPPDIGAPSGLTEFFARLRRLNEEHPSLAFTPDAAVWHDYAWVSDNLSDGVAHVRGVLRRNGFPAETRLWVSEWNTNWGDPSVCEQYSVERKAAHLAHNVVRELAPGGTRGLDRAHWFYVDTDWGCVGTALWTVPYESTGEGTPVVDTDFCRRPAFAACQALATLTQGRYVRASATAPLETLVVAKPDGSFAVLAVNHRPEGAATRVGCERLPSWQQARVLVQGIDAERSNGCQGLETGTASTVSVQNGSLTLELELPPESIRLLTLAAA